MKVLSLARRANNYAGFAVVWAGGASHLVSSTGQREDPLQQLTFARRLLARAPRLANRSIMEMSRAEVSP